MSQSTKIAEKMSKKSILLGLIHSITLSTKQIGYSKYNLFLKIGEAVILVYQHGLYTYSKLTESVIGGSDGVS